MRAQLPCRQLQLQLPDARLAAARAALAVADRASTPHSCSAIPHLTRRAAAFPRFEGRPVVLNVRVAAYLPVKTHQRTN
jgi:hypothetical protein